jgi:hypothetical protein
MNCNVLEMAKAGFYGFNQFSQIIFGFALGLAFSQANISVGWIFFYIIIWEFGVYLLFFNSPYYDTFFRIAYNCVFLLSIIIGQFLYTGTNTFQNFLYPNSIHTKKAYKGTKYQFVDKVDIFMDNLMTEEEKRLQRKKFKNRIKHSFS